MDEHGGGMRSALRAVLILLVVVCLAGGLTTRTSPTIDVKTVAGLFVLLIGAFVAFRKRLSWIGLLFAALGAIAVFW